MNGIIPLIVVVVGLVFWLFRLIEVVSMKDDEFDGQNDKLIFFMIVFFGSVFGAVGFLIWKRTKQMRKK